MWSGRGYRNHLGAGRGVFLNFEASATVSESEGGATRNEARSRPISASSSRQMIYIDSKPTTSADLTRGAPWEYATAEAHQEPPHKVQASGYVESSINCFFFLEASIPRCFRDSSTPLSGREVVNRDEAHRGLPRCAAAFAPERWPFGTDDH